MRRNYASWRKDVEICGSVDWNGKSFEFPNLIRVEPRVFCSSLWNILSVPSIIEEETVLSRTPFDSVLWTL